MGIPDRGGGHAHDELRHGQADILDDAITRVGRHLRSDKNAKKARSYFHEEKEKTFIGEPYERVMAYYYRGILYWMDGELDNARACFRSGELEDSSSEANSIPAITRCWITWTGWRPRNWAATARTPSRGRRRNAGFAKPPPY